MSDSPRCDVKVRCSVKGSTVDAGTAIDKATILTTGNGERHIRCE